MTLFSKKESSKKTDEKASIKESKVVVKTKKTADARLSQKDLSNVISKPRITEKAAIRAGESNAYTFNVHSDSNKGEIAEAIEKIYKVVPTKVNIIKIPRKSVRVRGKSGVKGGGKKAIVFLKKGDRIEFV